MTDLIKVWNGNFSVCFFCGFLGFLWNALMLKQLWVCLQWRITACLWHTWMFVKDCSCTDPIPPVWLSPSKSLEGIMSGRQGAAATSISYRFNRSSYHFMIWVSLSLHHFTSYHVSGFLTCLTELVFVQKFHLKMKAYIKLINNLVYCLFLTRPKPRSWDQSADFCFVMALWHYIYLNINFCLILIWQKSSLKAKTELWSVRFSFFCAFSWCFHSLGILVLVWGVFLMYIYHFEIFLLFDEVFMDPWVFPLECEDECENLFPVFVSLSFVLSSWFMLDFYLWKRVLQSESFHCSFWKVKMSERGSRGCWGIYLVKTYKYCSVFLGGRLMLNKCIYLEDLGFY